MQNNKKIDANKQAKNRKFHSKYVQLPLQEKGDNRGKNICQQQVNKYVYIDYDVLSMMGKRTQPHPMMAPQVQLYRERNYKAQILDRLYYVEIEAQKVLNYAKLFPEQLPGVICSKTLSEIANQLQFLITNFQLIQTEQVIIQQNITKKKIQSIQNNSKLTQIDKRNKKFQVNYQSRKYFKDKVNFQNFCQLYQILNNYLMRQRLKLEKQQTYGFSQQSVFCDMCRCYQYFTSFNDLLCNYNTIYQIPIDIPYLKSFNHREFLTQKHIDLLLLYFRNVEGLNDLTISDKCILNVSQSKDYLSGISPSIQLTKYKQAGLLFNYSKTQWFLIGVYNQEKKIIVYDSKFSHDRDYPQYIQHIQDRIFEQTKGTIKYQFVTEKQNLTQETEQFQNGFYIFYAIIHLIDNVFHDGFNNKIIRVLQRKRVVQRLRHRFRTFSSYLIWCQISCQPVRADVFSFLIRQALYNEKTFLRE